MPIFNISGVAINSATQEALANLTVEIKWKGNPDFQWENTSTDPQGKFQFSVDTDDLPVDIVEPFQTPVYFRFSQGNWQYETNPDVIGVLAQSDTLSFSIPGPPVLNAFLIQGRVTNTVNNEPWANLLVEIKLGTASNALLKSLLTNSGGKFETTFTPNDIPGDNPNIGQAPIYFRFSEENWEQTSSVRKLSTWAQLNPIPFELEGPSIEEPIEPVDPVEPAEPVAEPNFTVSGKIVQSDGSGVGNRKVEIFDKWIGTELSMGSTTTEADGSYLITYTKEDLCPGKERADLIVRVFEGNNQIGASPLIVNAFQDEIVNVSVGEQVFRGLSEFGVLKETFGDSLNGVALASLTSRDVQVLQAKLKIGQTQIAYYIKALKHQQETGISAEYFFGIYRAGISPSLNSLLSQDKKQLTKAIQHAARNNQINVALENTAAQIAGELKTVGAQRALNGNPNISELMGLAQLTNQQQNSFVSYTANLDASATGTFWENLEQANILPNNKVKQLEDSTQIAALTLNYMPLAKAIHNDDAIDRPKDLVKLNQQDWVALMQGQNTGVPEGIQGDTIGLQYENYASLLYDLTQNAYPTAAFAHQWSGLNGNDNFITFFENNDDFNFQTQAVGAYLAENDAALNGINDPERFTQQLKSTQVFFALTPEANKASIISPLLQNNMQSAHHIALMGESVFLSTFADASTMTAYKSLYQNATQVANTTLLVIMDYIDRYQNLPAYVFPNFDASEGDNIIPEWSSLFGNLDYCACRHCHSVLSPAAYLVDLLVYLNGATANDGKTAMEKLFDRRPDIANIDLTCENTNTTLPYIDLVNEVLENAINPINYGTIAVDGVQLPESEEVPQTEGKVEALMAHPEHQNTVAYDTLKEAIYPWNLPFGLWQQETHVYLDHLESPRHDLIQLFNGSRTSIDWALAYLNMLPETLDLITATSSNVATITSNWNQAPSDIRNGSLKNFLQLAGLSYEEGQQLVKCRFVQDGDPWSIDLINCSLEESRLVDLKRVHLGKIHRFERLRRVLNWSMWDLDRAIAAFESTELTEDLIIQLAGIQYLQEQYPRLSIAEILAWYSVKMDTWKYEETTDALYEVTFLNPAVNDLDQLIAGTPIKTIFGLNETFTELAEAEAGNTRQINDEGIFSICLSAINLSEAEYDYIISRNALLNQDLTLNNLSNLFRIASFLKLSKLSVEAYFALLDLVGLMDLFGPIRSESAKARPDITRSYLDMLKNLEAVDIEIEELDYLLRHNYSSTSDLPLNEESIRLLLEEIRTEFQTIETTYTLEAAADVLGTLNNTLNVLLIDEEGNSATEDVQTIMLIVNRTGNASSTDSASLGILMPYISDFSTIEAQVLDDSLGPEDRASVLITALLDYVKRENMRNYLTQRLAVEMEVAESVMESLLSNYITNPSDAAQLALDMFRSSSFYNSALELSRTNFELEFQVIELLYKIAWIIRQIDIPEAHLEAIFNKGVDYGFPDLKLIPVKEGSEIAFSAWYLLLQTYQLQRRRFFNEDSVLNILDLGLDNDVIGIAETLESQWAWRQSDVAFLLDTTQGLPINITEDANWLLSIETAYLALQQTGVSVEQLKSWTEENLSNSHSLAARNAAKAKHSKEAWPEIAQDLRDPLREKQRDALEAYVITEQSFLDAEDLYAHYLIDTQTNACMMTSRIVLAISSIQLFVQRARMNLEAEAGVQFSKTELMEWPWRKNYRVWEANRKVFLWPENWIEPELRDDKSPFFRDLEDALLQDEVNDTTVEKAYLGYLRNLDEVGHLEISASHYDAQEEILHVFGRTKGLPHSYYYRQQKGGNYWTAWEKLDLDIQGDHIGAIVYNRRLYLIWLMWEEQAKEGSGSSLNTPDSPTKFWQIKLAWSEYKDNTWSPAKVSIDSVNTDSHHLAERDEFDAKKYYFFQPLVQNNELNVVLHYFGDSFGAIFDLATRETILPDYSSIPFSHFVLSECQGDFKAFNSVQSGSFAGFDGIEFRAGNYPELMYINSGDGSKLPLQLTTSVSFGNFAVEDVWAKAGNYKLHPPSDDIDPPFYSSPFFCTDGGRTFLVQSFARVVYPTKPEKEGDIFTKPDLEVERLPPGVLDDLLDLVVPDLDIPDFDTGPVDDQAPLPGGYPGNDDKIYFPGGLGDQTIIVRNNKGADSVYVSDKDLDALVSGSSQLVSRSIAEGAQLEIQDAQAQADILNELLLEDGKVGWDSIQTVSARGFQFYTFYHPYTCLFIKQLNRYGIDGVLAPEAGEGAEAEGLERQQIFVEYFEDTYEPTAVVSTKYPIEDIDFTDEGAYSLYNWELFFHAPLLIATRLMQNQRFEEAQKWFHYIFDPTYVEGEAPRRFWKIKPFYDYANEAQTDSLFDLLSADSTDLNAQIEMMEEDPFDPHAIARLRKVAYMKTVVMKYLDNLIAWGDYLFRQDSMESINEATQLYVLAGQILGRRPVQIEKEEAEPYTFNDLFANDLFGLSNSLIALESELSLSDTSTSSGVNGSSILNTMLYFCIPNNEKLLTYWDIVADRLFKIRNCQNIEGITRSLALFQPPIDPAALVRAIAAGVDLSSVLQDLNAPLPFYRFRYMIQKANEFCNDVKALGGALLSALEKKSAEELSLLRSSQEIDLLNAIKDIRKKTIAESEEALEGLQKSLEIAMAKEAYYSSREKVNQQEAKQQDLLSTSLKLHTAAQIVTALGAGLALVPDGKAGTSGVASPVVTLEFGGKNLSASHMLIADGLNIAASLFDHQAGKAGIEAGYTRRFEEWQYQAELATIEISQIERQIAAAEIRLEIAKKELDNQELQIKQAREIEEFLQRKFTNKDLYSWMITQISGVFFQTYNLAYDMAKRAERCFQQELAITSSNYIQFGYYDSLKKGLLSGERLQKDLRRLETAYMEQNIREYELTKHISLRRLNPVALLNLKATGTCEVSIPEWLFDLDNPGHYLRRVRQISVSIPTISGPYTTVSCTLSLLKSSVRNSNLLLGDVYERQEEEESRFTDYYGAIQSIVTSSAQLDSGLFETNLQDERFLPFEYSGAISTWKLELPSELRQFDYNNISEVILHMRYTARQGGDTLKDAAVDYIKNTVLVDAVETPLAQLFSLKQDFPNEWYKATTDGTNIFRAAISKERFPYLSQGSAITVQSIQLWSSVGTTLTLMEEIPADSAMIITTPNGISTDFNTPLNDDGEALFEIDISNLDSAMEFFVVLNYTL